MMVFQLSMQFVCKKVEILVALTSLLHEAEEVVEELLPLGVVVDLVELKEKRRWRNAVQF